MKPMTEKMTNPANILVALFVQVTIMVSLQGQSRKKKSTGLHEQLSLVPETVLQY